MSFGIDSAAHTALAALFPDGPARMLGLSETEPVFDPAGYTGITEPTAASYERVQIDAADWPTPADRAVEADVTWPDTVDDLGVLPYWFLTVSDTDPTVEWAGRFATPLELAAGTSNITIPVRIEAPASLAVLD